MNAVPTRRSAASTTIRAPKTGANRRCKNQGAGAHAPNERTPADIQLQMSIDVACFDAVNGSTFEKRLAAFRKMAELVAQRSPEEVKRMEVRRGLA